MCFSACISIQCCAPQYLQPKLICHSRVHLIGRALRATPSSAASSALGAPRNSRSGHLKTIAAPAYLHAYIYVAIDFLFGRLFVVQHQTKSRLFSRSPKMLCVSWSPVSLDQMCWINGRITECRSCNARASRLNGSLVSSVSRGSPSAEVRRVSSERSRDASRPCYLLGCLLSFSLP